MSGSPEKDDEAEFNETLKRMLDRKPTPHKPVKDKEGSGFKETDPKSR